ncbi:30S ribosomal protein S8 [Candidatus Wolfebacteria bacterium]|nr:MAG: 30S ribosomal protein S8 [Candidatus Wolfebacteria bacterium]
MNDQISDLLVRIRNASAINQATTLVPYSKMKQAVLDLLVREGYIIATEGKGKDAIRDMVKEIEITLKYTEKGPSIHGVKRVSKLSRRVYQGYQDLRPVRYGTGTVVLSTPKGILTGKDARKEKVGGEVLFMIW